MRLLAVGTVIFSLISTNLFAAEASAPLPSGKVTTEADSPLPPGKPAGVAEAQHVDNTLLWTTLGLAAAGIIILATHGGTQTTSTTTTTQ
jgi:hypothetical protein